MNEVFRMDRTSDEKCYFGVKSTGIFCRPSCPSAQEEDRLCFHDIFDALARHYRPCLGCRPDIRISDGCGGKAGDPALRLPYRRPFDFQQILSFMRPRAIQGVEKVGEAGYARTFRTPGARGYFSVIDMPEESALGLNLHCDHINCAMEIYTRVRRMFDLDRDFTRINDRFKRDSLLLKGMKDTHVPRLPVAFDPFEFCIRAVLGQQISVKAATTLAGRIARKAGPGTRHDFPDGLDCFFPDPGELLAADLGDIGLTTARQSTIAGIARGVLEGRFSLNPNQSFDAFSGAFSRIRGVGEWTVNYVAMRGLGMADSFPAGDLGIIKALEKNGVRPSKKEILKTAERWRPYRAYAALCLWQGLS